MKPEIKRHPMNPIVRPGLYPWRKACVFNPGVVYDDGLFTMYERAAGGLRPFFCSIGMLESKDGINFTHASDRPVLTPEMCGSKYGSVQDPRVVKIGDTFYMTFAYRPFAWSSNPTGVGVPESRQTDYPGFDGDPRKNQTRSGIAVSKDRKKWEIAGWVNGPGIDDRDVVLFPEKIGGKFAALRRPIAFVDTSTAHKEADPSIYLSYSGDLKTWTEPKLTAAPEFGWENNRIGASTPPIRTDRGWLTLYHGVETTDEKLRAVTYRMGIMMLDLEDPGKVVCRAPDFIMEPEEYYEKFGLYIPNVVFPTASPVKNGVVHLYYGVCDTAIALATVGLKKLVEYVSRFPVS